LGLFRREPLHRRLAREGGLDDGGREHLRPSWDTVGIHGVARPREWDAVVTVSAQGLTGDEAAFVTLADGTMIVEAGEADADLTPLADAAEAKLAPPYRARAVRREDGVWAVAARRIEVATFVAEGEEIELTAHGDARTMIVDGLQTFGTIPELEQAGRRAGDAHVVRARRIDADLWELEVDPL
jgi:hypothetical protein